MGWLRRQDDGPSRRCRRKQAARMRSILSHHQRMMMMMKKKLCSGETPTETRSWCCPAMPVNAGAAVGSKLPPAVLPSRPVHLRMFTSMEGRRVVARPVVVRQRRVVLHYTTAAAARPLVHRRRLCCLNNMHAAACRTCWRAKVRRRRREAEPLPRLRNDFSCEVPSSLKKSSVGVRTLQNEFYFSNCIYVLERVLFLFIL